MSRALKGLVGCVVAGSACAYGGMTVYKNHYDKFPAELSSLKNSLKMRGPITLAGLSHNLEVERKFWTTTSSMKWVPTDKFATWDQVEKLETSVYGFNSSINLEKTKKGQQEKTNMYNAGLKNKVRDLVFCVPVSGEKPELFKDPTKESEGPFLISDCASAIKHPHIRSGNTLHIVKINPNSNLIGLQFDEINNLVIAPGLKVICTF